MQVLRIVCFMAASGVCLGTSLVVTEKAMAEEGWGKITGQILFDGEIPKPKLLAAKGNPQVQDPTICAANDLFSDELIVDPKTKGVANVFVFIHTLKAKGMKIHPGLQKSKQKEIVFDQKGCRFIPHVMIVRTDQTVIVKSGDSCGHNTHTTAIYNQERNFLLSPNDRKGVKLSFEQAEPQPLPVKCDIHTWMKAHWLVIDHPYATVTDKNGVFTIEKLPAGEVEFRIWHERVGWINRKYMVSVKSGGVTKLGPVKVPAKRFND